ncbi:unnamed protein product [Lasius platythorax]|uniref:Uncharacterized protein n=1 Tax=Lasius platythorax TaxID=488582 RepID=A0AAV2P272_9HYME
MDAHVVVVPIPSSGGMAVVVIRASFAFLIDPGCYRRMENVGNSQDPDIRDRAVSLRGCLLRGDDRNNGEGYFSM